MHSASSVAEYVLAKYAEKNVSLSNLKLQKILYFLQAEFLVRTEKPLFPDEILAWDIGPVVPSVYQKYRIFGGAGIPYRPQIRQFSFSRKEKAIIDEIVFSTLDYSASKLTEMTMHQNPWLDAYENAVGTKISNEKIKKFFQELLKML